MATQPKGAESDPSKGKGPLYQVKKWNNLAFWGWSDDSDICAICRASVLDACLTCDTENKADSCFIIWGRCSHSFHKCCMGKWIQRNNRCPLCQQDWKSCVERKFGRRKTQGVQTDDEGRLSDIIDVGAAL